jgi:hypothetical protein
VWMTAFKKKITLDNLRKSHIIVVDWCCSVRKVESINRLLIHYEVARELEFSFSVSRRCMGYYSKGERFVGELEGTIETP